MKVTANTNHAPKYEYEEDHGWLDTAGFIAHAQLIRRAIKQIGRASVGDIRRHLGEAFDDRKFFSAIEHLEGAGLIRQVQFGLLSRWESSEPRQRQTYKYTEGCIAQPADRTVPVPQRINRRLMA